MLGVGVAEYTTPVPKTVGKDDDITYDVLVDFESICLFFEGGIIVL